MSALPDYYFRLRDTGAVVFRVAAETRAKRLDMTEIAVVNTRNGKVRPHGETTLSAEDEAAIAAWLAEREAVLAARAAATPQACIEQLNLTAHWAQSRASDAELEASTEALLLAMHDLRQVLVRKKANRTGG